MKKTIISLLTLFTFASATDGCILEQSDDINVTWKAYKTLAKLGVSGQFTGVNHTPNKKSGKNFKEIFVGSMVNIDVSKIDTGDASRDKTLVKWFFSKLYGETIEGKIVDIEENKRVDKGARTGVIDVKITMNKKTLIVPMSYHYNKGDFRATGTIDLFDFAGSNALASLNKSCYDLHEGKTWNDVTIEFRTNIKATLCDVKIKK
ncbi:YceI family protein [Sulfurovum sp. bin170]|uniref:YceI family protein n=1 Tax=Sulfurovum sp. bin170 TaxID=2695268 RepID=UPI0013E05FFE|nr:YceI family protein [Sulfurovum sp. bin170]NEW61235.1 YceI family protein [Sulfurovum sp. bin170]